MPLGDKAVELPRGNLHPEGLEFFQDQLLGRVLLIILQQDVASQLRVKMTPADRCR